MSAAGWVIVSLCMAVAVLVLLLAYAGTRIEYLMNEVEDQHDANHAKCIAHIADFTSKRVVAMAFRDAAERYDTVPEQKVLHSLRRRWSENGPSIPAMWLDQQAALLDPPTTPTAGVFMIPKELKFP